MPVKSSSSSVIRWPDQKTVLRAIRGWVKKEIKRHPDVIQLGYFGSYARGDWGVGSDLDLIAIVEASDLPFERRSLDWDLHALPVQAEILVYTITEWRHLLNEKGAFSKVIKRDAKWVYRRSVTKA